MKSKKSGRKEDGQIRTEIRRRGRQIDGGIGVRNDDDDKSKDNALLLSPLSFICCDKSGLGG